CTDTARPVPTHVPTPVASDTNGPASGSSPSPTLPVAADLHGLVAYSTLAGDIWVMNADSSGRRQVTNAGGNDFDPSLSPDGRRVVFRTSRGTFRPDPNGTGVEGIFVIDLDGTHER